MILSGEPFLRKIALMLPSSCGSLDLEQIDRAKCNGTPMRFVFIFGGPK